MIIETDLRDDVDDAGALAVAHALSDAGALDLLAIGINTCGHWSESAARVINSYYGRPGLPVGVRHPVGTEIGPEDYARAISRMHPEIARSRAPREAVGVLRAALAAARSGVTLVSIGYYGNLVDLLRSGPDEWSPLNGAELVRRTVVRTLVMGGRFGGGSASSRVGEHSLSSLPSEHNFAHDPSGLPAEHNFAHDPAHTAGFLQGWPGPVDFVGWEAAADVVTGRRLHTRHSAATPVAVAYALHSGKGNGRPSWDPLTVLLAAGDLPGFIRWSSPGTVSADFAGRTQWVAHPGGRHRHAIAVAPPDVLAAAVDDYLERPPLRPWGLTEERPNGPLVTAVDPQEVEHTC
ncbi:nucleoside hydrolase [Sinosporangium siamense]|uniref:nucleoside hydrolase n=1 Tax=Sinosporangium siamense TaxID=1367973 RepID=UPI0035EA70D0